MRKINFSQIIKAINDFSFPDVDLIVGIARGGVVPAALIGYRMKREVKFLSINYRDDDNVPLFRQPKVTMVIKGIARTTRVLLVDDVAVTGATLNTASKILLPCRVETMVLKGSADYVLFPKIKNCVQWPWANMQGEKK
jgi:hypoxanthine phosphoribosyltransferase